MSRRLKDQKALLKMLAKVDSKERKKLLSGASDETVKCICECALNTLKRNVKLTEDQFRRLRRHKHTLRFLADRRVSLSNKKKKVKQAGGFLIPLLVPIIGSILAAAIQ
jgi:predicted nucleic acid-binding protein